MSTKQTVLSVLQAAQDFVSGEALAAKCGLSRTSVWKAIKALQNDGFRIAAAQNHGYKLVAPPDVLSRERILHTLTALGAHAGAVSVFPSLDSTLSESKRQCAAVGAFRAADGTLTAEGAKLHRALIVTGLQTAGRGRMGRPFVSPAHSGVYFTLIYAPKGGVTNPALLTAAGVAAEEAHRDARRTPPDAPSASPRTRLRRCEGVPQSISVCSPPLFPSCISDSLE